MYEDRTQNYNQEIHEEYLIHNTPFPLPHHLPCADCSIAIDTTNRLKCNNFLLDCEFKI